MSKTRARTPRWVPPPTRLDLQLWDLEALLACLVAFWHSWRSTYDLSFDL